MSFPSVTDIQETDRGPPSAFSYLLSQDHVTRLLWSSVARSPGPSLQSVKEQTSMWNWQQINQKFAMDAKKNNNNNDNNILLD